MGDFLTDRKATKEAWEKLKSHLKETLPNFETYEQRLDEVVGEAETRFHEYRSVVEDFFKGVEGDGKTTVEDYKKKVKDWFNDFLRKYSDE